MFRHNISLRGGVAPVRGYIQDLMKQVLAEKLDPSPVLDMKVALDDVPKGQNREAIAPAARAHGRCGHA